MIRNDEKTIEEIREMSPDYIVLSPGPGKPKDAGCCIDVVKTFAGEIPILGVCLGHQAICEAFGATVSYAKELMHGKTSLTKNRYEKQKYFRIYRNRFRLQDIILWRQEKKHCQRNFPGLRHRRKMEK